MSKILKVVAEIFVVILLIISCKKPFVSTTKAISNADESQSFSLIPARVLPPQSIANMLSSNPISGEIIQLLHLSIVVCKGKNAKQNVRLIENYFNSSGEALKRNGSDTLQAFGNIASSITNCRIEGGYSAGPVSVSSMLLDLPSISNQALFLAMRGPVSENRQAAGPAFYEFIVENYGIKFSSPEQYGSFSRSLDILYNPCVLDVGPFEKFKYFSCSDDGHYLVVGDFSTLVENLTHDVTKIESKHIVDNSGGFPYAIKLYEFSVKNLISPFPSLDDSGLKKNGVGAVFSPNRVAVAKKYGLQLSDSLNHFTTRSNPIQNAEIIKTHIDQQSPKNGDNIAFYEKLPGGDLQRSVVTQVYNLFDKVGSSGPRYKVKQTGKLFLDNPSNEETTNKDRWIAGERPKVQSIVDDYRAGRIDGNEFRQRMSEVTNKMPFGKGSDRGNNMHNCVDIAFSTSRCMYPILPEGVDVGQMSVEAKGKGGKDSIHKINYFLVDGQVVAYDQQSGAMSAPSSSIEDALKDEEFRKTMKGYGLPEDVNYEPRYSNGGGAFEKGLETVFGPSDGGPKISIFSPDNPKYNTQRSGIFGQVVKDGTHGKYDVSNPEAGYSWYDDEQASKTDGEESSGKK